MKRLLALGLMVILASGCSSVYYGAKERAGMHKRDILVERVEEAREAQEEGREQFRTALDQYRQLVSFYDDDSEDRYQKFEDAVENSGKAANEIRDRIERVEEVAGALFEEWREEIDAYNSENLRADSQVKLASTRRDYTTLMTAMQEMEKQLDPALEAMNDQLLHLKHNLNAQEIATAGAQSEILSRELNALLSALRTSIDETDDFLSTVASDATAGY